MTVAVAPVDISTEFENAIVDIRAVLGTPDISYLRCNNKLFCAPRANAIVSPEYNPVLLLEEDLI